MSISVQHRPLLSVCHDCLICSFSVTFLNISTGPSDAWVLSGPSTMLQMGAGATLLADSLPAHPPIQLSFPMHPERPHAIMMYFLPKSRYPQAFSFHLECACVCIRVCMYECGQAYTTTFMWRTADNLGC